MQQPTEKIQAMLSAFQIAIENNSEIKSLFEKAINNQHPKFVDEFINMMLDEDADIKFEHLDFVESETLYNALGKFTESWCLGVPEFILDEFANFMNQQNDCTNPFFSYDQTLVSIFNKHNETGHEITRSDIFELEGKYEALKQHILKEAVIYKDGKYEAITFLPDAWSEHCVLVDLSFDDELPYTPMLIDVNEKRVFMSLQGDQKIMFDTATYDGWMKQHLVTEACDKFEAKDILIEVAKAQNINPNALIEHLNEGPSVGLDEDVEHSEEEYTIAHNKYRAKMTALAGFDNQKEFDEAYDRAYKLLIELHL